MSYIKDNFLLKTKTAEKLYEGYAKNMPIFDYHCLWLSWLLVGARCQPLSRAMVYCS